MRQFLVEVVELVLIGPELFHIDGIRMPKPVERVGEVPHGDVGHVHDLLLHLLDRKGRSGEHVLIDIVEPFGVGLLLFYHSDVLRNDALDEFDEFLRERKEQEDRHTVEERVEHGELGLRCIREQRAEDGAEVHIAARDHTEQQADDQEDDDTARVEEQVDEGRAFRVRTGGHAGDDGDNAGTDVGTHRQVNALIEGNESDEEHGDGNGGHDRRALDDRRQDGTDQDQQQRVLDRRKERLDRVEFREALHGVAHHGKTDEQHTETGEDAADFLKDIFLRKGHDERADTRHRREQHRRRDRIASEHTEGNDLTGDGRTDVGTEDDGGRLDQRHDAGIDETDDHDGGGTGALDGCGGNGTDADAEPFTFGYFCKHRPKLATADGLQVGAHHGAGDQEDTDAGEQGQDRARNKGSTHL